MKRRFFYLLVWVDLWYILTKMKKLLILIFIGLASCKTMAQDCPKMKNFGYVKKSMESWVVYVEYFNNPTYSGLKPKNVLVQTIGWEYKNELSYLIGLYEDGKLKKVFPILISEGNFTHIKGVEVNDSQITNYMRSHNYVNVLECR